MLAQIFTLKENSMSKQLSLFDPRVPPWVARLWDRIDPEKRRQILMILAAMARSSLTASRSLRPEEASDESK